VGQASDDELLLEMQEAPRGKPTKKKIRQERKEWK
jgi:hypothetical protein